MRIFISAGEPSGDVHGANLARALTRIQPDLSCTGFGGNNMASAGCDLLDPVAEHAVMGFLTVLSRVPKHVGLIAQADRLFRHDPPDAVVLIDCPGFNWWIARRARAHRIPVFYFVPPQLWAWASWRVKKMRKLVDHVLCSLPFEVDWYRERGVTAEYVGHPFFDELPRQQLNAEFLDAQRRRGGTIIGILPGSRTQEVEKNALTQLRTAEIIHRAHPETRFLVACFRNSHQQKIDALRRQFPAVPIELCVHQTPEIIELSKACISVSGSVSLELLYRAKPTVIVYRVSTLASVLIRPLVNVKHITLVNLLADKRLYPEFTAVHCEAPEMARAIVQWLDDEAKYAGVCRELLALRERVAVPGACEKAARRIVDAVARRRRQAA